MKQKITIKWNKKSGEWTATYPESQDRSWRIASGALLNMLADEDKFLSTVKDWAYPNLYQYLIAWGFDPATFRITVERIKGEERF